MAFTERYVTDAAAGGGAGTEGDPWTLAEALTSAAAGDRVNILSDSGYSLGADTVTNAGTAVDLIVFRGYNSAIGDLQNPGRSATTGKLVTTGFPIITLTGILTPNAFVVFQNLAVTGALSSALISSSAIDNVIYIESEVINTQNNSGAKAILGDNNYRLISSDFECTGASHGTVVDVDTTTDMYKCRIKAIGGNGLLVSGGHRLVGNIFIGDGSSIAIDAGSSIQENLVVMNTIYNWGTAYRTGNSAPTGNPMIMDNHITDCTKFYESLRIATDLIPLIELNNRTRDNTTPRTGAGDGVLSGEVTTDTGGAGTDFTNAGADDFSLISAAPGREVGLGQGSFDIGAWQGAAGGGGGGGGAKLAGLGGGLVA